MSFILCYHHLGIHWKIVRLLRTENKSPDLLRTMLVRYSFVPSNSKKSVLLTLNHGMQYVFNTETCLLIRRKTYLLGLMLRVNTIGSTWTPSRSRAPKTSAGSSAKLCTGTTFLIGKRTPLKMFSSASNARMWRHVPRHVVIDAPTVEVH